MKDFSIVLNTIVSKRSHGRKAATTINTPIPKIMIPQCRRAGTLDGV